MNTALLCAAFGLIHFYVGKPRNGKSLRVMMQIIDALTKTQQHVVTNMVLRLDALQEYLDAHGHNVHVLDRVTVIDDEQTKNFWLYRANGYVLPVPESYAEKEGANVDYSPLFHDPVWRIGHKLFTEDGSPTNFNGTCYVIDEVQNIWPARGWQGSGKHVAFYLSQHGKLGDTVYFITQNVKNVDPIIYRVAQDFTYCRNHRMEKHGRFRGENKFSAKTYPGPVQDGNEVTLNVEEFKLDLEIAACYDTSAGVGMPGGGTADAGFRAKGIPLKLVWVGLAVVLCGVYWVFNYGLPHMASGFFSGKIVRKAPAAPGWKDAPRLSTGSGLQEAASATVVVHGERPDQVPELEGVWVEIKSGAPVVHAILGDGSELPPRWVSGYNLNDYPSGWVEARGVRYFLRTRKAADVVAKRD